MGLGQVVDDIPHPSAIVIPGQDPVS